MAFFKSAIEKAAENWDKLAISVRENMEGGFLSNRYRMVDPRERPEEDDKVLARFGLLITLYVENSQAMEKREAMFELGQRYAQQVGPTTTLKYNDGESAYKKITNTGIDKKKIIKPLNGHGGSYIPGTYLHIIEKTENEAEFFNFDATTPSIRYESERAKYGYVRFSYPLSFVLKQGDSFFADNMTFACKLLKPVHATAGFGLLVALDDSIYTDQMEFIYPLLRRHPGIEASSAYSLQIFNKMGSVNWLTAIKQEWLDKIGGMDALRQQLQPKERFPILQYDGGCIIQAGPAPLIGDRDNGILLDDYRKVAAALKSLRIQPMDYCPLNLKTRYKSMFYQLPGTWQDGTDPMYEKGGEEYLTRFD